MSATFYTKDALKALIDEGACTVGERTYGAPLVRRWGARPSLIIGDFCSIAENVTILLGGNHRADWATTYPFSAAVLAAQWPEAAQIAGHPADKGDVRIGSDVWIGEGALILSGVSVGDGAVIGARAVVAKDVPPYAIVVGNPARVVRLRFDADIVEALLALQWWLWPEDLIKARMALLLDPDPTKLLQASGVAVKAPTPADATPASAQERAGAHLAQARAHRLSGETALAEASFRAALVDEPDSIEAYVALSELRLPGEGYQTWLTRLHAFLQPAVYLEIGVDRGRTLALAQPPTTAIGVDPAPKIDTPFSVDSLIFKQESDAFFATDALRGVLGRKALGLAFIDGLHVFAQSLRDFMNVERFCDERSIVLFHDTLPLDEITQRPEAQRSFYTGDIWKTVVCLKRYRPDLEIFTIATPWSGLTVVTGLDPRSRVLSERYEEAVAACGALRYEDHEGRFDALLGVVPNDWALVEARLRSRPRAAVAAVASDALVADPLLGRTLYLDLLIRAVSNTIYEDGSVSPYVPGPFNADVRAQGLDWPAMAHSMAGLRRLENVRDLTQRALDEGVPGDFIETGVWRGGCCILMRGVLAAAAVTDRKVWVADSFEGLPAPNTDAFPQDEGVDLSVFPQLAISLDQVQENFRRYGLLDDQVAFVKGFFSDTLPALDAGPFALIRLDGDLYESTMVALECLYPKVSSGGFVIIDDFNALDVCRQAVLDFRARMAIDAPMHDVDWTAVWWRKP